MECALSWTRNMKEINVKENINVFNLPFLFGRMRPSNGFSLTLPVCICFFQEKGKREVGSGNQLLDLYTTLREFHPFPYPRYSHKSQTDQFEYLDFMPPHSSFWMWVPFSRKSVASTSSTLPLLEVRSNTVSQAQCATNAGKGSCETCSLQQVYQKERLMLFWLHKASFSATLHRWCPKNCSL